jgi:hypothetical protein
MIDINVSTDGIKASPAIAAMDIADWSYIRNGPEPLQNCCVTCVRERVRARPIAGVYGCDE